MKKSEDEIQELRRQSKAEVEELRQILDAERKQMANMRAKYEDVNTKSQNY